ncbi:MAG: hypothetical protein V1873_08055 [Verrucomicrobiota bacterium]
MRKEVGLSANVRFAEIMIKGKWIATLAMWFALTSMASAHPPYVEPWMHATNVSISAILGVSAGILLRKKTGIPGAIGVGFCVFLICGFGGWFLSIVASM